MHGDPIQEKKAGVTRIFFENVDGLRVNPSTPARNNNPTLAYFSHLLSRLQVDVVGGVEARTNWPLLPSSHSLGALLNQRDGSRSVVAHNEHERFSIAQQGGTFMSASPFMSDFTPSSGKDPTGLGRWCWIRFGGDQCATRIVVFTTAAILA